MDKSRLLELAGIVLSETQHKDLKTHAIELLNAVTAFRVHLTRTKNSTWFGSNIFRIHGNRQIPNIDKLEAVLEQTVAELDKFILQK